jgi:hypothetical protein
MCEHLLVLDAELKAKGIKETFRGEPWSKNTREWVYYDCVFSLDKIKNRLNFPDCVVIHVNDDIKSGKEAGFYCELCKDGVIGIHPEFGQGKKLVE